MHERASERPWKCGTSSHTAAMLVVTLGGLPFGFVKDRQISHYYQQSSSVDNVTMCVDQGPFPCFEDDCPAMLLSCHVLAHRMQHCSSLMSDVVPSWKTFAMDEELASQRIDSLCVASCGQCTAAQLRATVSPYAPTAWPTHRARAVERVAGNMSSSALAPRISAARTAGPLVITDALGPLFQPSAWTRSALSRRCSAAGGAPPPSPPSGLSESRGRLIDTMVNANEL